MKSKFPKYVTLENSTDCAMQLTSVKKDVATYYRAAGNWECTAIHFDGGIIVLDEREEVSHLVGMPMFSCTQEHWRDDNSGYVASQSFFSDEDDDDDSYDPYEEDDYYEDGCF